jgi:signal transduction histidine kinase
LYVLSFAWIIGFIVAVWPLAPTTLDWLNRWIIAEAVAAAVLLILALVSLGWQYRVNSAGVTRQQIRWVIWGALLAGGVGFVFYILPGALGLGQMNPNLMGVIMLIFPLAVAVAIVRHNLFDIDTILNRTLVYGILTVSTMGLYIFLVGYIGNLFQVNNRSLIAFLATGLVAILFQPLRERLQRLVNRFMYGERDDPAAVLSKLGERLEVTIAPEAVLPGIVETVAQTLKLPYVAIEIPKNDGYHIEAAYGLAGDDAVRLPLVYQAEPIGFLVVTHRAPDEPLGRADKQLLENIAHQAGPAVHAVQLTKALQESRQRLVTAREEERRRLRRDLHDGLGPHLASQMLTIDAIGKLSERDPIQAESLLQDLKRQAQTAITDIRRLVYDLRPPALDDLGLVAALREGARHYQQSGLRIDIDAPERLPALPAAIEVAAYRIAQEALTNVIRHAQATTCRVWLSLDGRGRGRGLNLQIQDNGRGLPPNHRAGVGCQAMRERATELGGRCVIESLKLGGTRVSAWLPLSEEDA